MTDGALLIFGCAVSVVAFAGIYVYLRESFTERQKSREAESRGNVPVHHVASARP